MTNVLEERFKVETLKCRSTTPYRRSVCVYKHCDRILLGMSTEFVILVIEGLRTGVKVLMCNVGACLYPQAGIKEMAYPGLF